MTVLFLNWYTLRWKFKMFNININDIITSCSRPKFYEKIKAHSCLFENYEILWVICTGVQVKKSVGWKIRIFENDIMLCTNSHTTLWGISFACKTYSLLRELKDFTRTFNIMLGCAHYKGTLLKFSVRQFFFH